MSLLLSKAAMGAAHVAQINLINVYAFRGLDCLSVATTFRQIVSFNSALFLSLSVLGRKKKKKNSRWRMEDEAKCKNKLAQRDKVRYQKSGW